MIDVKTARKAYDERIIDYIKWIRENLNLADAITKSPMFPEFLEASSKKKILTNRVIG